MNKKFKKINPVLVESDDGIVVDLRYRTKMVYAENERSVDVWIDNANRKGRHYLIVYPESIKEWLPPHSQEIINKEKRNQIVDNIRQALDFLEINHEFEPKHE